MGGASGGAPWIDTHAHLMGKGRGVVDFEGAARAALAAMDQAGIARSLIMPPPQPPDHPNLYECDLFLRALRESPRRFGFLCGGGSLNPMIHAAGDDGGGSPELHARFDARADELIALGALGFGEMTALHLSHFDRHPFESVAPDHPLFLRLADLAARHGVPVDLHMDAVLTEVALPPRFASPPNPPVLRANVAALERLLAHNRRARIVWVHAGSDFIGHWTVSLSRALLVRHPNLYMSIRLRPPGLPHNSPSTPAGDLKPEWLDLLRAFPDRFVVGSDTIHESPWVRFPVKRPPPEMTLRALRAFLDRMPPDLARKVAHENAARLYKLPD